MIDAGQVLSAVLTAGAAYAGIRVELKFLWRSLNEAKADINKLREKVYEKSKA